MRTTKALSLVLLFALCCGAAFAQTDLSRDEARALLGTLPDQFSGQKGAEFVMDKTGLDIEIDCRLEDEALHFIFHYKSSEASPISQEMAKLVYASQRTPSEVAGGVSIAELLKAANCNVQYQYIYQSSDTVSFTLEPDEILRLKTQPFEQLGFDRTALINELIECFNREMAMEPGDDSLLHAKASLHGAFITLAYKFSTSLEFLSQETTAATKTAIMHTLIGELGPAARFTLTRMAQTGTMLDLKGIKIDYSDISGRQKVYVYTWSDIANALDSYQTEALPYELAELALDAIDKQMNINFAEEEIPWTQTHLLNDTSLRIFLECHQTEAEFDEYFDIFTPDIMLSLYAEALKIALEDVPEVMFVFITPLVDNEEMITIRLTRDEIFQYVPEEDSGAPFVDDSGLIHA